MNLEPVTLTSAEIERERIQLALRDRDAADKLARQAGFGLEVVANVGTTWKLTTPRAVITIYPGRQAIENGETAITGRAWTVIDIIKSEIRKQINGG